MEHGVRRDVRDQLDTASGRKLEDVFAGEEAEKLRVAIAAAFELGRVEPFDPFASSPVVSSQNARRPDARS